MNKEIFIIGAGVGGLTIGALLSNDGYLVRVLEKSPKLGGRTASMVYKNHILDNGFHIMPFYKKSAIFSVFKKIGITSRLKLAKVNNIAFHSDSGFLSLCAGQRPAVVGRRRALFDALDDRPDGPHSVPARGVCLY